MSLDRRPSNDIPSLLQRLKRPARAVVTGGMPYANGPVHLGHLAGALVPPDIHARWLGMLIGRHNVLFVCGCDEHGSTSELAALKAGKPVREFVEEIQQRQQHTLSRYGIELDVYSGTSRHECLPLHTRLCQSLLLRLRDNGLLQLRVSRQWYDPKMQRFLPDRYVRGRCPNPDCGNEDAYSDECDRCGRFHASSELQQPRSTLSDATPELRDATHWWLDMWSVSEVLRQWVQGKDATWRSAISSEVRDRLLPSLRFAREHGATYREHSAQLPKHRSKRTPDGQLVLQFDGATNMETAREALSALGIRAEVASEWAYRPITRDIAWGVPLPEVESALAGKTLYVWPDSLIAPISFSQVALARRNADPETYKQFWCDPQAAIYQFVGQDNVFFYTIMQGALWLGSQADPGRLPVPGELQLSEIVGAFHLLVGGEKMSKSKGNFITGDQLLDEHGFSPDQIRYYLALLGLAEKSADFDFAKLQERNHFLAGPINSALERPISAAHSKFEGKVPQGKLLPSVEKDTQRMVARYLRAMERVTYPSMLFELENYGRTINGLFAQYKPHDDRHPLESRTDALYSAFHVLKNFMIMLYPFAPQTMERVRVALQLPAEVFSVDELGSSMLAGHAIGAMQEFFPSSGTSPGRSRSVAPSPNGQ